MLYHPGFTAMHRVCNAPAPQSLTSILLFKQHQISWGSHDPE